MNSSDPETYQDKQLDLLKMKDETVSGSCPHVESLKTSKNGIKNFKVIYSSFVVAVTPESRKRKAQAMICFNCGRYKYPVRLHACLECIFFGCYAQKHIHEHAKATKHYLGTLLARNFPKFINSLLSHHVYSFCSF